MWMLKKRMQIKVDSSDGHEEANIQIQTTTKKRRQNRNTRRAKSN